VKTSLCSFCLKSGILCSKCQAKLKSGEVSETDLKIARLLLSLEATNPTLQDVCFLKAVETGDVMALIVGRGDLQRFFGQGRKIIKILEEKVGKSIRILEESTDDRKFLEDLFAPLSIITINTIWLPDGTTETRVILRRRGRAPPPIKVDAVKEIARRVRNITLRVEFD
jgi:transcription antitermination factor NusA-like protein